MPRNSVGTMSAPTGQPVVSGTTITISAQNALVADLMTEITDSLSRTGRGGMTAPLRTANGTAGFPAHSFTDDTDTGLYLVAAGNPAMAVNGTKFQEWTTAGTSLVAGNIHLTQAGDQSIGKDTSGRLVFGTSAGNNSEVQFIQNGTLVGTITTAGDLVMQSHKVSGLSAPAPGSSDAATAAYVDGKFPAVSWTAPVGAPSAGFGSSTVGYWKDACGVVHMKGSVLASGTPTAVFSLTNGLPAGVRPAAARWFSIGTSGTAPVTVVIGTDGSIALFAPAVNLTSYFFDGVSFVAEQ